MDEAHLLFACDYLCAQHAAFAGVIAQHGVPSLRPMVGGFEGLLLTVTEQFLSLKAAAVIWQRIKTQLGEVAPHIVLQCSVAQLMALGLSGAKARSFLAIAEAVQSETFIPAQVSTMDDETARRALLALPGVGPWTADIYLLAALQRPDVWPWGDLALQVAAQDLFALSTRPGKREMLELGDRFKPWRAVAARLLWSHYRGLKNMKQA